MAKKMKLTGKMPKSVPTPTPEPVKPAAAVPPPPPAVTAPVTPPPPPTPAQIAEAARQQAEEEAKKKVEAETKRKAGYEKAAGKVERTYKRFDRMIVLYGGIHPNVLALLQHGQSDLKSAVDTLRSLPADYEPEPSKAS